MSRLAVGTQRTKNSTHLGQRSSFVRWAICLRRRSNRLLFHMLNQLVDAVGQPLFSVILSRSIYLSIYLSIFVRRFSPQQTAAAAAAAWCSAYGQTVDVRIIFSTALCVCTNMSPHYNQSPAVNIYRRHRRMRSSSASRRDYRLVVSLFSSPSL